MFAPKLLGLMGALPEVIARGQGYTAVMLGGNATVLLLFLGNAVFRGAGDAAIAMRVLWLANGLNILLGPCFIFGLGPFPELGVMGASVATNIGRGTGVVYVLYRLWRGGAHIRVQRRHLALELDTMATMVRLSATGMFQMLIGMTSWLALIRILSGFGSAALAGYTIAIRIIIFALLPSWGLSNAAATLVGQNLGLGNRSRRAGGLEGGILQLESFSARSGWCLCCSPNGLSVPSRGDASVAAYGVACLRTVSLGFLFYAYGMVMSQAFNGAGAVWTPTFINLFCFWLWQLPLAYVLARPLGWGRAACSPPSLLHGQLTPWSARPSSSAGAGS